MSEDATEQELEPKTTPRRSFLIGSTAAAVAPFLAKFGFDIYQANETAQTEVDGSKAVFQTQREYEVRRIEMQKLADIEAYLQPGRYSPAQNDQMIGQLWKQRQWYRNNPLELTDYKRKLAVINEVERSSDARKTQLAELERHDWRLIAGIFHTTLDQKTMLVEAENLYLADDIELHDSRRSEMKTDPDTERAILLAYYWKKMIDQFQDRGLAYAAFRTGESRLAGLLQTRFSNEERAKANIDDLVRKEIVPLEIKVSYIEAVAKALEGDDVPTPIK